MPSFGITFGDPTRDNLFPTDVYTLEYDGFADFPQYPIDPRSELNAFAGMIYEHLTYLELSPEQIQNAHAAGDDGRRPDHLLHDPCRRSAAAGSAAVDFPLWATRSPTCCSRT